MQATDYLSLNLMYLILVFQSFQVRRPLNINECLKGLWRFLRALEKWEQKMLREGAEGGGRGTATEKHGTLVSRPVSST